MSEYIRRTWADGEVIDAAKLNNMETGISEAKKDAEQIAVKAQKAQTTADEAKTNAATAQNAANAAQTTANSKATVATYTATVTTTWTANGDYFYQDIAVPGILTTDEPMADIIPGSDNAANVLYSEAICKVFRITTSADSIRVWATEAVETAFPIKLKVVR